MEDAPPFTLTVFDRNFTRKGTLSAPNELDGAIRVGAPGDLTFAVDADDRRVKHLQADGARVRCDYRYSPSSAPQTLISGPVTEVAGSGTPEAALRTFTVSDDWHVLNDTLGLPNPAGTAAQQGASEAYYSATGPAETVLKQIVEANRARLSIPLVVPATQGRGATITTSIRMHSLAERLFPAVTDAGLIVRVLQRGSALPTLEVSTPTVRSRVLTQASGVVVEGDFQLAPPTVTRVWVGAGGVAEARIFRLFVDDALELRFGGGAGKRFVRERFVDARDVGIEPPATALTAAQEAVLQQRANEVLQEGAPRGSLAAKLAETETFRFGRTFQLGDRVSLQLAGGPVLSDYVREVQFKWDASGVEITPLVGSWAESVNDEILKRIADTMRAVRDMQRGF